MLKQLSVVSVFVIAALLHYLGIIALVDVFTFVFSVAAFCAALYMIYLANIMKEGCVLDKEDYKLFTTKHSLHRKLFNWFVKIPVVLATLIYIEASVCLGLFLLTICMSIAVGRHFNSFEWSEDGYCIRKKEEEK